MKAIIPWGTALPSLVQWVCSGVIALMTGLVAWLKNQDPIVWFGLGMIAFAVMVIFFDRCSAWRHRKTSTEQQEPNKSETTDFSAGRRQLVSDWHKEWHELRFRRSDFWVLLNRAHDHWKPREHLLQEVIAKAQIPSALPLDDNSGFPQWVWEVRDLESDTWSDGLNGFAKAVYDDERSNLNTLVFGGQGEFDRFDGIRRELSKFWDEWGRQKNIDDLVTDENMENPLQSSSAELKILTFLEIARARWNPTGATGKSGLFTLARKASKWL